jgi:hypothetical protein
MIPGVKTQADDAPTGSALAKALLIPCRRCQAKPGEPCMSMETGVFRFHFHPNRVRSAWRVPANGDNR